CRHDAGSHMIGQVPTLPGGELLHVSLVRLLHGQPPELMRSFWTLLLWNWSSDVGQTPGASSEVGRFIRSGTMPGVWPNDTCSVMGEVPHLSPFKIGTARRRAISTRL